MPGKRRFDVVAVWRFDRFAKSTKHLLLALEEFRALGVQFVSYQENIDTTTRWVPRGVHHRGRTLTSSHRSRY